MFPLGQTNKLHCANNKVWGFKKSKHVDAKKRNAEESYLLECLEGSQDLTSSSVELQRKIRDRSSEYHMSPARANLIRGLNLDGMNNVLELGCGCGAITRYLAEKGKTVEAVEACPAKASLARLRCGELKNVHIINANYCDLSFPDHQYDVIVMIGMLEPSSIIITGEGGVRENLMAFIGRVKKALRPEGVLLVATENRMGLKLLPHSGENRPQRTTSDLNGDARNRALPSYGKKEWENILKHDGEDSCVFICPFPDYRFTRVLLTDYFIESDRYSYSLLYRILSTDAHVNWQADDDEFFRWKALHEADCLAHFANSFLMLVSSRPSTIRRVVPFDFIHFSSENRKLRYRTCTTKRRDEDWITKKRLFPSFTENTKSEGRVSLKELGSDYERGPLVSTLWLEACAGDVESSFSKLLHDYYSYVRKHAENASNNYALVDLLPSNLVAIAGQSEYKKIDQEWDYAAPYSTDFILFRALLWFGFHNRCSLSRHHHAQSWKTVRGFIEYCFTSLSIKLESQMNEFVALENGFHAEVAINGFSFSAWALLEATLKPENRTNKIQNS